jgi:hypothetical protein
MYEQVITFASQIFLKYMIRFKLLIALTLFVCSLSFAQITPNEQLQIAQEELRIAESALIYADNEADFRGIENNIIRGLAAYDTAMSSLPEQTRISMTPYQSFFLIPGASVMVKMRRYDEAQPILLKIDSMLAIWHDRSDFALNNPFDTSELLVTYYMVAEARSKVWSGLAACNFHKGNFEQSLMYDQKVMQEDALEYEAAGLNYLRATISAQTINNGIPDERIRLALEALERYSSMAKDVQLQVSRQIGEGEVLDRITPIFESNMSQKSADFDGGEAWARAARTMTAENKKEVALNYTKQALAEGHSEQEFLLASIPVLKGTADSTQIPGLLNKLATIVSSNDCAALGALSDEYEAARMTVEAKRYKKMAEECRNREKNEANKANRDFGWYVGGYVLPLFRTDWGVVTALQTRRHFIEFSYQQLSDRRDQLRDLRLRSVDGAADQIVRWDGYYGHVSLNKIKGKRGAKTYSGILLGYNLRQYQSFDVPVIINEQNNQQVNTSPVTFSPIEERFIVMLNSGSHFYGRWLAGDVFFSWGGAMAQFQRGNKSFDFEDYNYNNPMLNARKSTRFLMMARFGITIGLQLGTRTFKK